MSLLSDITKAEKRTKDDIQAQLNRALSDKKLLSKIDKLTDACSISRTPPKNIAVEFVKALKVQEKKLKLAHPAADFTAQLKYTQNKGKWRAQAVTTCGLKTNTLGGVSYVIQPKDTLWAIAQKHYGYGGMWPAIEAANPKDVKSNGDFILAGSKILIPKQNVPVAQCGISQMTAAKTGPKPAMKPAKKICMPAIGIDFGSLKPETRIYKGPVFAWKVTVNMTGTLHAICDETLGGSVTIGRKTGEIQNEAKLLLSSFKIDKFGKKTFTVQSNIAKAAFNFGLGVTSAGELIGSMKAKKVEFKINNTKYVGQIGIDVTIRPMPRVKLQDLKGRIWEFVDDYGDLILGGVIVASAVGLAVVAVPTLATPVPGDEYVAYGTAIKLLQTGVSRMGLAH